MLVFNDTWKETASVHGFTLAFTTNRICMHRLYDNLFTLEIWINLTPKARRATKVELYVKKISGVVHILGHASDNITSNIKLYTSIDDLLWDILFVMDGYIDLLLQGK